MEGDRSEKEDGKAGREKEGRREKGIMLVALPAARLFLIYFSSAGRNEFFVLLFSIQDERKAQSRGSARLCT